MFKYDTVHGQFNGTVEGKPDGLYINGKKIAVFQCMKVGLGGGVGRWAGGWVGGRLGRWLPVPVACW